MLSSLFCASFDHVLFCWQYCASGTSLSYRGGAIFGTYVLETFRSDAMFSLSVEMPNLCGVCLGAVYDTCKLFETVTPPVSTAFDFDT